MNDPTYHADYSMAVPGRRNFFLIRDIPGADKPFNVKVALEKSEHLDAFFLFLNAHGIDAVWGPRPTVQGYGSTAPDPAFKTALKALADELGNVDVSSYSPRRSRSRRPPRPLCLRAARASRSSCCGGAARGRSPSPRSSPTRSVARSASRFDSP